MAMELKVIENVQKLSWNFEEIKSELANHIARYKDLVVSETNLPDMEKTHKEIASLRVKISKFKVAIKKDFLKPYDQFELEVKQLLELVEKAETPIKDQIEKYETERRDNKRVEVQKWIDSTAADCGLGTKYSTQIVIDEKWLNRTATKKATIEEIQMRVAWFLDIQTKEVEAETFRQQKVEMAKFLCESLSVGLVTPVTFAEIENRVESLDLAGLKTHIGNEVAKRKEREERAAQQAIERADKEKKAVEEREKAAAEKLERAKLAEEESLKREAVEKQQAQDEMTRKRLELENAAYQERNEQSHLEHIQRLVEANKVEAPNREQSGAKLLNAQFVLYGVTEADIEAVGCVLKQRNIEFKFVSKPVNKAS
jgi:hypothetical protein